MNTGCFLIVCVRCQQFLTSKTWAEIVRKSEVFKKRDATIFWAIRSLNPVLLLKVRALTTQILFLYAYRCLSKSRYFGGVFGWYSQNSRTYEKTEKGVVCSFLWFESYIKSWLDFLIQWFQMSKLIKRVGLNIAVKQKLQMKVASLLFKTMCFSLIFVHVFYVKNGYQRTQTIKKHPVEASQKWFH